MKPKEIGEAALFGVPALLLAGGVVYGGYRLIRWGLRRIRGVR